jgi:heptosyltransferase-2
MGAATESGPVGAAEEGARRGGTGRSRPAAAEPARILVVQTAFLGDAVLATPVFAALKRHWPRARSVALVRPEVAPALEGHPHLDEVWVDDKRGANRGIAGLVRIARRVRRGGFDLAIGLQKSLRTALVLALAGVPLRAGFRRSAGWFLYHRWARVDPARHSAERQLAALSALGIDTRGDPARPYLQPTGAASAELERALRDAGSPVTGGYVVVAPASVWPTKQWTAEGYAAVARRLCGAGETVVFVGAPAEVATVEAVWQRAGCGINLAGKMDAGVLVAAIARASAVVCNDSAPMHIAQALGIPVVAIFGPTARGLGFWPRFAPAKVVERDLACRPCSRHGGHRCPIGTHECMRSIAPAEVLAALEEVRAEAAGMGSVATSFR